MDVLRKVLCALKFTKMHTKSEKKYQQFYFVVFLLIKMEINAHITSILVFCSVQCLFCFKLVIWKVQEVKK